MPFASQSRLGAPTSAPSHAVNPCASHLLARPALASPADRDCISWSGSSGRSCLPVSRLSSHCCSRRCSMRFEKLTFRSVTVRPVLLPLRRPVVSKVGLFDQWPVLLIDLQTEEGIVGRSYLEPYLRQSARYIVPVIHDLAAARRGQPIRPVDDFQKGAEVAQPARLRRPGDDRHRGPRHGGLGCRWRKAAGMPLAVFLGGRGPGAGLQQQRPVADGCRQAGRGGSGAGRRGRFQGRSSFVLAATGWPTTLRPSSQCARRPARTSS